MKTELPAVTVCGNSNGTISVPSSILLKVQTSFNWMEADLAGPGRSEFFISKQVTPHLQVTTTAKAEIVSLSLLLSIADYRLFASPAK